MASTSTNTHLHNDASITDTRLRAFAMASLQEQRETLAILRERACEDHATLQALVSLVVATLLVFLAPLLTISISPEIREQPLLLALSVLGSVAIVLVIFIHPLVTWGRDSRRKELATVWVAAYEDELARLHRLPGRAARRWRQSH